MKQKENPWVLLGAGGQLGRAFKPYLPGHRVCLTRQELDLENLDESLELLDKKKPSLLINAAAFTAVDQAESCPEKARNINALAPERLAQFCHERDIPFVHFSTDYVFSGEGDKPWQEESQTGPLSEYGRTKLEGENRILGTGAKALIFRCSWLYSHHLQNFYTKILRKAMSNDTLTIVSDQYGAPTYCPHLAEAVVACIHQALKMDGFPAGIYHICHAGETTWFNFAKTIVSKAKAKGWPIATKKIDPILSKDFSTPAQRPRNSRLCVAKIEQVFRIQMPSWEFGLEECIQHTEVPNSESHPA